MDINIERISNMFGRKKKKKANKEKREYLKEFQLGEEDSLEQQIFGEGSGKTIQVQLEKFQAKTPEEKRLYLESCQERIDGTRQRLEELKREYTAVNRYLSDIHLIETMPEPQSEKLLNLAKKVIVLEKDRKEFGRSMSKLSNRQFSHMRECEPEIQNILKNMAEDEKYCETVKTDMRYLEGERAALMYEKQELTDRLYLVKGISKIGIIAFAAVFLFLVVLQFGYNLPVDMIMYGELAVMAIFIAVIFIVHGNAERELGATESKLNRAILLLNKVKIKYVNVVNRLEYVYELHGVKSAYQLNKMWGVYLRLQKEHEVYNKATNRLIEAEEDLVNLLKFFDVKDAGIWVNQAYAIIDKGEMEEIKSSLNKRRSKLKSSMDYNQDLMLKTQEEIKLIS